VKNSHPIIFFSFGVIISKDESFNEELE